MQQEEVIERYRRLRGVVNQHLNLAFQKVPPGVILEHAKSIGLACGRSIVTDDDAEFNLISDLAVFAAKPGRSRAIDRYAKAAGLAAGLESALVLRAMQESQFGLYRVERRHDLGGLVLTDILRKVELWLMDEAMTMSMREGAVFASRLCRPDAFAMALGVLVPIGPDLVVDIMMEGFPWLRHSDGAALAADPRCAAEIYRAAINAGVMERVSHLNSEETQEAARALAG